MQAKVSIRIRQQSEMHETTAGLIWGSRYLKRRFWGGLISMIDGQMMARNRKIHYVRRASLKWANRREKPKRDSHIPKKANLEWMGRHRIDGKRSQKVRNQHRSINRSVKPCPSHAWALNSIFGQIWIVYCIGICQGAHRSTENISTIPPRPYANIFGSSYKAGQPNINPAVF